MAAYKFATDSEMGTIEAVDWSEACSKLEAMLPERLVEDGAWGWVEDEDGERFNVNFSTLLDRRYS